jgi:hypothetical protein
MGNYKIIATPQSDTTDKLKAYYAFLEKKRNENIEFDDDDDDDEMTQAEVEAYIAGWQLAFDIAKHNFCLWFPEAEVSKNG